LLTCSELKADILKQIKPYLEHGAYVGTIFGQGGFNIQANYILGNEHVKEEPHYLFSAICAILVQSRQLWQGCQYHWTKEASLCDIIPS